LDKNQTQELIFSLRIILVGILFWVIKVRYFTFFWLPQYHFLNVFGLEIVGTVLILAGILIIHRVYPFAYSYIAILLILLILVINILDFFLFRYKVFREIQEYTPFVMSLMLVFVSKIMESGTRYFNGQQNLPEKWKHIAVIIFFGFSIPYYTYVSSKLCGFIRYDMIEVETKFVLLFIPLISSLLFFFFYYLHTIVITFKFLYRVKREN
jgi:hypothetical protein